MPSPSQSGQGPFLRILLGPTASGKERVAMACAAALTTDIISVDSMKIYRGLDVGTAKASTVDRERVRHRCVDIADPREVFSAARYVAAADQAIGLVAGSGGRPLLSGGSALYFRALLQGLFEGPAADAGLRAGLERRVAREGAAALHAELAARDQRAAERIHPGDARRIVRALEVIELTGRPISSLQEQWDLADTRAGPDDAGPMIRPTRYGCAIVGLDWPRQELHRRIEARIQRMLEAGLVEEAREVWERRGAFSHTPLQAVGYKEFFGFFAGESSLEECVALLARNTRRLAKSQMTWFRRFPCSWIAMSADRGDGEVAAEVLGRWQECERARR